jgi:ribonucleoside-triphosphate reductase
MAIRVLKRDGKKVEFDIKKIYVAIKKAATNENIKIKPLIARKIAKIITFKVRAGKKDVQIEEIQDLVVNELKKQGYEQLANKYQEYRLARTKTRESKLKIMDDIHKIGIQTDRDNANVGNNFSAKLLRIASEANKWHILSQLLPVEFANAHIDGDLYIHDLDSYNLTTNCLQIPTGKLLAEGFDNGYGYINSPKSIEVAAELSCIMLQSSQNDLFGGQGHPNFDNDLAPYVKLTYQKILAELKQQQVPKKEITKLARAKLIRSVSQAMQSVVYNLNSMHSRAGSQVPFSSLNIGIPDSPEAAMICQAFLEEYLKGLGNGEQPIFPNVIFRVKKGVNRDPGDPYYYLFKIACHTASQRMNPTFMNIDADFNMQHYENGIYPATMGCRTYVMSNVNGKQGSEGRGNIAPNTINIVRLAITAKKDINKFFTLFDEKIDLAKRQLLHRYDVLKKLKAVDLPFAAGQRLMVGSEKLKPNDSIEPILKQGTWSIGFIGLAETLKLLTGKHHGESKEAQELGLRIVSHLRNRLDEFKRQYKMN